MTGVLIGVGNEFRRDDGIGPAVAAEIGRLALPGVRVLVSDGEPTALLEAWTGCELAVVVDAVVARPRRPGRMQRTRMQRTRMQRMPVSAAATGAGRAGSGGQPSSHGLGVAEAWALGQALGRVPAVLVVYAIEVDDLGCGPGLSPAVAEAVPAVVRAVRTEFSEAGG